MSIRMGSGTVLRQFSSGAAFPPCCIRGLESNNQQRRHLSNRPAARRGRTTVQKRLDWEREKRDSLRATLVRQYEDQERPKWGKRDRDRDNLDDDPPRHSARPSMADRRLIEPLNNDDQDIQCGIFWDIENVRNYTHPPAIVIEAIRDFAGCRLTPVFQAYMSRPALNIESRTHAIYAQLGVTFIQCHNLGKDTADKKIISDMWKFYASVQRVSPKTRIRIILITGDRDFADAIGQLRNFGVEIGILTGSIIATAPVYDDYTLGMRVLPLLGIIEARARDIDLNAYQASKRLSLSDFEQTEGKTAKNDFVDEERLDLNTDKNVSEKSGDKAVEKTGQESLKSVAAGAKAETHSTSKESKQAESRIEVNSGQSAVVTTGDTAKNERSPERVASMNTPESTVTKSAGPQPTDTASKPLSNSKHQPKPVTKPQPAHSVASTESGEKVEATRHQPIKTTPLPTNQKPKGILTKLRSLLIGKEIKPPSTTTEPSEQPHQTTSSTTPVQATSASPKPTAQFIPSPYIRDAQKPICTRHLTREIPIKSSIFSASNILPPQFPWHERRVTHTSPATANITALVNRLKRHPTPSKSDPTSLLAHYTTEVLAHRPEGLDEADMKRLWDAWVEIDSWSGESVTEASLRRAAKSAFIKGLEILEVRKELRQSVEDVASVIKEKEKNVFMGALGGKDDIWYPLTEGKPPLKKTEDAKASTVDPPTISESGTTTLTVESKCTMEGQTTNADNHPPVMSQSSPSPDMKLRTTTENSHSHATAESPQDGTQDTQPWTMDLKDAPSPLLPSSKQHTDRL